MVVSTEDEFGTCAICYADDWLAVDEGEWLCQDCQAERVVGRIREEDAEEYARTMIQWEED